MQNLKPFDIVLFKGTEIVSKLISKVTRLTSRHSGEFTHVAVVISSDILDSPHVHKGKVYLWEATMSGKFGDGIKNVAGKSGLCVQLRDCAAVFAAVLSDPNSKIGIAKLKEKYRPKFTDELKRNFTEYFYSADGSHYNLNLLSVLATAFKPLRIVRKVSPRLCKKRWKFCSELVCDTLKFAGIFPDYIESTNITPMNLIEPEKDENPVPRRFHSKLIILPISGDISSSSDAPPDSPRLGHEN